MSRIGAACTRLLPAIAVIAAMLGSVSVANAEPPPPPGWRGAHYYWHGHHYHHREWAYDAHHHRYMRYW